MHELSVATNALRRCRIALGDDAGKRIESVRIAIGELAAVDPDQLRFAWDAITSAGPDAEARLEIEWREAMQLCEACGACAKRVPHRWHLRCPTCGGPLRVEGGWELEILEYSWARRELATVGT